MNWIEETHGTRFELVRHFLARMFDSELCSIRGQWVTVAVSAFALLLPCGILLVREGSLRPSYAGKYRYLAMLSTPEPFRAAALADELALLTVVLAVTGLIGLLQWQALFPARRDYTALASLPVRPRDVFIARFAAIMLFSSALVVAMNLLPSVVAPLEFGGRWQKNPSYLVNLSAQAVSSGLGCFFILFALMATQGVLLNILPARLFARLSVYVQGALTATLLLAALLAGFIQDLRPKTIARLPEFGAWAPPVWFAGLHEKLLGDGDPFFAAMADRALMAFGVAAALTVLTYSLSYRRYRSLLLETPIEIAPPRGHRWSLLGLLSRDPRQQAILQFMAQALARSRTHGLVLLAYAGAALALLLNTSLLAGAAMQWSAGWRAALQFAFLVWPLAMSAVILPGFRHVFSLPVELGANWIFQITESQGRAEWMSAVERFVFIFAVAPVYVLMLPIGVAVLGWPVAARAATLDLLVSLSMCEVLFYSWQQLPFTCSYRPGKRPMPAVVGSYAVVLCVLVPVLARLIAAASQMAETFAVFLPVFAAAWLWLRKLRREGWGEAKLLYEDVGEIVPDLGIKELTHGRAESQLQRTLSGHAGHADSENPDTWSDARLCRGGVHPTDLPGCPAGGGGRPLSGTASTGDSRPAGGRVGAFREQQAGEVLPADPGGATPPRGRDGTLGTHDGRHRPHHGSGLMETPLGEPLHALWLRLKGALRRRQLDRDLEEELEFHVAMRQQRHVIDGATAAEARVAAQRQFGNLGLIREACRDLWTFPWVEALWQDARYGFQNLRRRPSFTAAGTITLALGIGAATTMFSVCDALVWKTIPLPGIESLVAVLGASPDNPHLWSPACPADIEDIRRGTTALEGLASWAPGSANIVDAGGEPVRVEQTRVTPNLFRVLGVAPVAGRAFLPGEDEPGREREVILSDGLWRRRYRADSGIVGKSIRLNDLDYTVVGIMPPGFAFPKPGKELWTPLTLTAAQRDSRTALLIDSVGRLKPGRTAEQFAAELKAAAARLEDIYPNTNRGRRFMAWPMRRYLVGGLCRAVRAHVPGRHFVRSTNCVRQRRQPATRPHGRKIAGDRSAHGPRRRPAANRVAACY